MRFRHLRYVCVCKSVCEFQIPDLELLVTLGFAARFRSFRDFRFNLLERHVLAGLFSMLV